jgi:TolB-like protein/tetratricopeptide (TPR) repeat protein
MRTIRDERRSRQQQMRRRIGLGIAALFVVGAMGLGWRWKQARAAATAGASETAKHIAVLYFQDLSPDKRLTFLADGLTEGLIDRLRDVQTLDVVSRDGVAPFRQKELAPDSVARLLKVGTLVTGTVEPEGSSGRVRVGVRLLDGATGTEFRRGGFTVPEAGLLTARDSLAGETSRMLREYVGDEVRLRESREQARDVKAWSLVQLAERLRQDGERLSGTDSIASARVLDSADALLVLAESRDPQWSQPTVMRARIALQRAKASRTNVGAAPWVDAGLVAAERALKTEPRSADALEIRGTLRFERFQRNLTVNPAEEKALVRDAESDLLRATQINPAQATAWNALSTVDYRKTPPDLPGANINARRALEADAYLAAADEVLSRLFATSYDLGQHDEAVKWCNEGHRRYPESPRFVKCRLYIGLMKEQRPDVDSAWSTVRQLVALTPPARRPVVEREARMLAAAPLVYAGQADSARRVLVAARADRSVDPEGQLLGTEALIRVRLGERADAVRLLKIWLSDHPQHIPGMSRNTWWWKDLENDSEYKALIGHR